MTDHKAVRQVEVKDAAEGRVRAVVARMGVVDRDGDIIEPGAFGEQEVIVSPFGHSSFTDSSLPVGRGTVREVGDEARANLQFFMDSRHGRDAFRTVQGLGDLGEWSFGFDVAEAADPSPQQRKQGAERVLKDLDVHEVSPVARGAGIGTRTVTAKAGPSASAVAPVEVEVAAAKVRKAATRLRIGRTRAAPGADTQELGEFALRVGYKLAGFPELPWRKRAPDLEWFVPRDNTTGYIVPGEHKVNVSRWRRGRDLVRTVLHEVRHIAQEDPEAKDAEEDAHTFAERWGGAVKAAHRATGGDPHRVHVRDGRPPFYGDRIETGDVVLSRSTRKAYRYNPRNRTSAWGALAT